jgi:hypothetical protein
MQDKEKRWRELAALAAIEQDPKKINGTYQRDY